RVISKSSLRAFWTRPKQSPAREPLTRWYDIVESAAWRDTAGVKATFGVNVDFVQVASGNTVAVFDAGGNKYRIIAANHFSVGPLCEGPGLRLTRDGPSRIRPDEVGGRLVKCTGRRQEFSDGRCKQDDAAFAPRNIRGTLQPALAATDPRRRGFRERAGDRQSPRDSRPWHADAGAGRVSRNDDRPDGELRVGHRCNRDR
ncbi:MAG: type II toxin-antitoxin system HigB family toxin, partial [Chthoniobacterales bacterium]|nr:type II toxin-antitoxin system HigB family toxin [Chthoniobacterales bacterium]